MTTIRPPRPRRSTARPSGFRTLAALVAVLTLAVLGARPLSAAPQGGDSTVDDSGVSMAGGFPTTFPSCFDCSGQVNIWLLNQTDAPVTFTFGTEQRQVCASNRFETTRGSTQSATAPPLAPGQFGAISMSTGACGGVESGTIRPESRMGSFTLGLLDEAQFEFGVVWIADSNFDYFDWNGDYTGDGDTGGMYMYDCSSDALLGAGEQSGGGGVDYDSDSYMCFVVQDGAFDASTITATPSSGTP